jgi:surfeit locus 1 family protein
MKAESAGMSRYRPLALPFLFTLIGVAVLIGLGVWQLERREWKLALIDRIDQRAHGEAISLSEAKRLWQESGDVEYDRVLLVGHFLHDYERHLYSVVGGQPGWRIITPLETRSGDIVLVDRGFVPSELKEPAKRQEGQISGDVELTGLARAPEKQGRFTPDNEPQLNRWFWRDVPGMLAALPQDLKARAVPFMVEAEAMTVPGGWPRAGVTRLELPNRHLEYAITWFGLAATLIAVFAFYVRSRLQLRPPGEGDATIADEDGSV